MFDVVFSKFWRGFEQRNLGLSWIRAQCGVGTQSLLTEHVLKSEECNGVVYFADDDNKYDLRLFEQVRHTPIPRLLPASHCLQYRTRFSVLQVMGHQDPGNETN